MRIAVTGGAGFIGAQLIARLCADAGDWGITRDSPVVVLDNLYRGTRAALAPSLTTGLARFVEGDIRDAATVAAALHDADIIFHLAALSNVLGAEHDSEYAYTTNLMGTHRVLEAALATGAQRVVLASSREVYGEPERLPAPESAPLAPKNTYGASKAAGELCARAIVGRGRLDVVALRLTNVYGPGDSGRVIPIWLQRAVSGEPLVFYGGQQVLDLFWVQDAVSAFLAAARTPRARFAEAGLLLADHAEGGFFAAVNGGAGHGTPLAELAERIREAVGRPVEMTRMPARSAEVGGFVADISGLRSVLGIAPDSSLRHLNDMAQAALATTMPSAAES